MAQPIKVLILEDVEQDAELMLLELRRSGLSPAWSRADSEATFLTHLKEDWDVILADYSMPAFNALRALHLLQDRARDIPFIVVTGSLGDELAAACIREGAADFLLKDRLGRLGEAIAQALERKRLRAEARKAKAELERHAENLERVVAERTAELQAIQQSMVEGLVVLDSSRIVRYMNRSMEDITGLRAADFVGQGFAGLRSALGPDIRAADANPETLRQVLAGVIHGPHVAEVEILRPRRRELSVTFFPIQVAGQGDMLGLLARDVTEQKEMERRRDTFVSVASHELRTPLTTIVGYSELLLQPRVIPVEKRQQWIQDIHADGRRLTAIVDDLLNVSRIQFGKLALRLEPVALRAIIERVVGALAGTTQSHDIVVAASGSFPLIIADEDKLGQVLTNLVTNAIKYSPRGGMITVSARVEEGQVNAVVAVADQGIGIAPEDQERLFATFSRIRTPETEGIRGSGLGLYIVKSLVDLMGGRVWLESRPGKGSTFFVALPIAQG